MVRILAFNSFLRVKVFLLSKVDKVIFPGISYENDCSGRIPRMQKKFKKENAATVITTLNTPSLMYRLLFGNALKKVLFTGTFWKTGYKNLKWISFKMVKFW